MPIDAYSLCPGGTDRKIKFCCADLLADLEKIDRMVEGEQYLGCLQHIERLQQQGQRRACLLATKGALLRATGQWEAASANDAQFREQFPDNPIALAEAAILRTMEHGALAGMAPLQQLFATRRERLPLRAHEAIGVVAEQSETEGRWLAARALYQLQANVAPDDQHALESLMHVNHEARMPLMLKSEPLWMAPPPDTPWKDRFQEAIQPLTWAHWQGAADRLAALADEFADVPEIWRALATIRGWLADNDGCAAALRKRATLAIPLEDAVEAETAAMLLSDDPLGDNVDVLHLEWTVTDQDRFQEALLSDARVVPMPFNPGDFSKEDEPPPRLIGVLLDRPRPATAENLTLESMPRLLCQLFVFGRQTDRAARLEVIGLSSLDLALAETAIREIGGATIEASPKTQVAGRTSATRRALVHAWHPPEGATREQVEGLALESDRQFLLETWPAAPLPCLQGKSPREAAADPQLRITVLAAICLVEHWHGFADGKIEANTLRSRLDLPVLGPVEVADAQAVDRLPLARLARVVLEKIDDEGLLHGFRRALLYNDPEALRRFAGEIVARQSLAEHADRLRAYRVLAQTSENLDDALHHLEQGRKAGQVAGQSCASWDLMEFSLRLARQEFGEVQRIVRHIQSQHLQEPGVPEALTQMLIDVGALNPDGTPAMRSAAAPPAAEEAPARGGLWTPGSEPSGGGGGKLWTPS
jgi:hypothetical protein